MKDAHNFAEQAIRFALLVPELGKDARFWRKEFSKVRDVGVISGKIMMVLGKAEPHNIIVAESQKWARYTAKAARRARKGESEAVQNAIWGAEKAAACAGREKVSVTS